MKLNLARLEKVHGLRVTLIFDNAPATALQIFTLPQT